MAPACPAGEAAGRDADHRLRCPRSPTLVPDLLTGKLSYSSVTNSEAASVARVWAAIGTCGGHQDGTALVAGVTATGCGGNVRPAAWSAHHVVVEGDSPRVALVAAVGSGDQLGAVGGAVAGVGQDG